MISSTSDLTRSPMSNIYVAFAGIGTFLIVASIMFLTGWATVASNQFESRLLLAPDSARYNLWKDPDVPIYKEIYMFNVTNTKELWAAWKKDDLTLNPVVHQLGPYTFLEKRIKTRVSFNSNQTVTYKQRKMWIFDPKLSNGTLTDKITTLNVLFSCVGKLLKTKGPKVQFFLDTLVKFTNIYLFRTHTVQELLFDGYTDQSFRYLKDYNICIKRSFDKFAWYYGQNYSEEGDGTFNIYSDEHQIYNLGSIYSWNFKDHTNAFPGPCSLIRGQQDELMHPMASRKNFTLFLPEYCSSITLKRTPIWTKLHELKARRYAADIATFDAGRGDPYRACYHIEDKPSGVRPLSGCLLDMPVYLSFPHFYLADKSYISEVNGLNPDPDEHEFYYEVEPHTGIPLRMHHQFQLNLAYIPVRNLSKFSVVPPLFIPAFWYRYTIDMPQVVVDKVKMFNAISPFGYYLGGGLLVIGIVMSFVGWNNLTAEDEV